MAEKLIPGIPLQTRIAILQQTSVEQKPGQGESAPVVTGGQLSVLETVIDRATSRSEIQQEIDGVLPASKVCLHLLIAFSSFKGR